MSQLDPTGLSGARSGVCQLGVKIVKTWSPRGKEFIVKIRRWAPSGKNTKKTSSKSCEFFLSKVDFAMLSRTRERGDPDQLHSLHRTKGSSDLASSEVTRIAATSAFLELVTGDAGEGEVVSRTAARDPPPTRAG